MIVDPVLAQKLASNRFKLDRVYKMSYIRSQAVEIVERGGIIFARIPAHAKPWEDVVFEFDPCPNKSRAKCRGVGRVDARGIQWTK